ncbi:Dihydrofolate synthase [Imhoffiella purpurea]|uniref:Dihydrofolate synthase/folylpolyglutamate synthase n=1 Tax=Imhoffiella purpurea TaxID=1249627 RepID=W9VCH2_9GAMM|nr:Dihydrofolate synthase [Imhoffiella purpurea]
MDIPDPSGSGEGGARRFDRLQDWLDWQLGLNPKLIELGLQRVAEVWRRLGHGAPRFPVVTVGGTNGKGSCVAMIDAIARAAGYRCGTFTSPHLLRYNERIRIDGEPVGDESLCESFERIDRARGDLLLTYFEFGTLAALDIFVRESPDLAVLEVGLGGRLDAVNLLDADVSVVTSIGRDHTAWLGETLDEIAVEKAGIFRADRAAILGQSDAPETLRQEAIRLGARPLQMGRELIHETADAGWIWQGPGGRRLSLPLPAMRGRFQLDNASAAIAALMEIEGRLPLPVNAIRAGLQRARLPGRFEVQPGTVTRILDVAHNGPAACALAGNLRAFKSGSGGRVRAVLAILSDKDPEAIVEPLLPHVDDWYLSQSDDGRALSVDALARSLSASVPRPAGLFARLEQALDAAHADSETGDSVLILGSFTTVGQALRYRPGI